MSTASELIMEKLIEQRDDGNVISCNGEERLVKLDKQFHHSEIPGNVLAVTSSQHQGKYLCLRRSGYPSAICYIQLAGT